MFGVHRHRLLVHIRGWYIEPIRFLVSETEIIAAFPAIVVFIELWDVCINKLSNVSDKHY